MSDQIIYGLSGSLSFGTMERELYENGDESRMAELLCLLNSKSKRLRAKLY